MCIAAGAAALGLGKAAAAVGGVLKGVASVGGILQGAGTIASVAGGLRQSRDTAAAIGDQIGYLGQRRITEAGLTAAQDERVRASMRSQLRRQTAELAARGIDMSSPTAVALAEAGARELSFASQAVRSQGAATDAELTASMRSLTGQRRSQVMTGRLQAGADLLTGARDLWPGLLK